MKIEMDQNFDLFYPFLMDFVQGPLNLQNKLII